MGNECFTCKYKLKRERTAEEIAEAKRKFRQENDHLITPSFELEFKCKVSGALISQTDKACRYYEPDPLMLKVKNVMRHTISQMRKEIRRR